MKPLMKSLACILVSISVMGAGQKQSDRRLYDLKLGKEIFMSVAITQIKQNKIILVGEHHGNKDHHEAQLDIIRTLKETGIQVAIGLEMFRSDSQEALDRWIDGSIGEDKFRQVYDDNWNYPWQAYRIIFNYARKEKIPLIGLNVPRSITRQVSQKGFKSLTASQKGQISNIACRVDEEYMKYIKKAFGAQAHGNFNFNYFCEAQLVWDNVMAINALNYLKNHPAAAVVVLTGVGHAQKSAVPRQIRDRSQAPVAVILPEVKGSIDSGTIGIEDADYIMLGF